MSEAETLGRLIADRTIDPVYVAVADIRRQVLEWAERAPDLQEKVRRLQMCADITVNVHRLRASIKAAATAMVEEE